MFEYNEMFSYWFIIILKCGFLKNCWTFIWKYFFMIEKHILQYFVLMGYVWSNYNFKPYIKYSVKVNKFLNLLGIQKTLFI